MSVSQPNASVYTDFQGLAALKGQAANQQSREALESVARQFESLFMQMMLKSMRQPELGSDIMGNDQTKMFQDMYDKQLVTQMAADGGNGIGIAEALVKQLQGTLPPEERDAGSDEKDNGELTMPERQPFAAVMPPSLKSDAASVSEPQVFETPEQFVETLWPHAQSAAKRLGVAPEALLAQAALETGWGKSVIRDGDGNSSFNLFNIKADHRWSGEQVSKNTLEYRDGVAQQERAQFRRYGSYEESFDDYANFIAGSPRYRDALQAAAEPNAYVKELQRAGYATDPAYAAKIERIMGGETMANTLSSIKNRPFGTLS